MGNKESKNPSAQLSNYPPPQTPKNELNILLMGISRTGKSLLFYEINKMINTDDSQNNSISTKFKIDQQKALSSTLSLFRRYFTWEEKEELELLKQFILTIIPHENIDNSWEYKTAAWPCLEIWKWILNNATLRNIVEKKNREGIIPDNFYKLMENIQKGNAIHEDNYYLYCYFSTRGIIESMGLFNNVQIKLSDSGGAGSEVKNWTFCAHRQDVIFLTISLVESLNTTILEEGLVCCRDIAQAKYLQDKKKILLFTKADLLPIKLRNGATYSGKMECEIVPELVNISIDCNMRNIVNSIVSLCMERIGRENFDSFHLISSLSSEDVKNVLLSAVSNERRNTISKFLCYSTNNFSNKMLQYCSNGKCTDIQITFQ